MDYSDFLAAKRMTVKPSGFDVPLDRLNPQLFEWQRLLVRWALKKGKAAFFEDCGLGKTGQQLEWAWQVFLHTGGNVLILTPLCVAPQTLREGIKFGIPATVCREPEDIRPGINIANYERLDKFAGHPWTGVVLDESSILKSYTSATRNQIIETFEHTPYKLACTATPAPNDYMELGNHAEFLGAMKRTEMLSSFFIHDGGDTNKWRLKGHAQDDFWAWIASWAVVLSNPANLGFPQDGYNLPPLNIVEHVIGDPDAPLAKTLTERRDARKASIGARVERCAQIAAFSPGSVLCWCDFNEESRQLAAAIPGAVEVTGSDTDKRKALSFESFSLGLSRVLVSKPKIAGWGLNWQHCNTMIFCGLSDSFEAYYQAVRRCWRFGQTQPVIVHIVTSAAEGAVKANIERKQADAQRMAQEMEQYTREIVRENVTSTRRVDDSYKPDTAMRLPGWLRTESEVA